MTEQKSILIFAATGGSLKRSLGMAALVVVLSCASICFGKYSDGDGSEEKPYRIATAEDMNQIGANPNDWDAHFVMVNDINLAEYTGTEFNIIGNTLTPFTGVFDGNGHAVLNFTYHSNDTGTVGLFGYVYHWKAKIKDLILIDPDVSAGEYNVGALAGTLTDGTIANCAVEGGSISGYSGVGGLVGENNDKILNCYASSNVWGNGGIGGLVGSNSGVIFNCYASGSVSGNDCIGGLVGGVGMGSVSNCYATGRVSGNSHVGGLVGMSMWGTISNCYASGSVSGTSVTGGLIGHYWYGTISTSFWDIESTGQSSSAGGEGKTTAQMMTKSTFTNVGWDFVDIWDLTCEGMNYPRFIWQITPVDYLCPDGVNFIDYSFFAGHWMDVNCPDSNDCNGCDLDFSYMVDANDLNIFCDHWLEGL